MVFAPAAEVESKPPLRKPAQKQRSTLVHGVDKRSQLRVRDAFNKEFQIFFVGRGADRVGALDSLTVDFDTQSRILAGQEREVAARVHVQNKQLARTRPAHDTRV